MRKLWLDGSMYMIDEEVSEYIEGLEDDIFLKSANEGVKRLGEYCDKLEAEKVELQNVKDRYYWDLRELIVKLEAEIKKLKDKKFINKIQYAFKCWREIIKKKGN